MRKTLLAMTFVALLAPATAAAQEPWTSQGAELLKTGWAVEPFIGYPQVGVRFHVPLSPRMEIVPSAALFFGEDFHLNVGNEFGAQLKIRVFQQDIWNVSVNPGLWVLLGYHPAFTFGLRVDPDVTASVRPLDWLAVYFGMHFPITLWTTPDVWVNIPVRFRAGVEFTVAPNITVYVTPLDLGPSFWAGRRHAGAHMSAWFLVGASFKL